LVKQRSELLEIQNGILQSLRQALPGVIRECETTLVALALQSAQKLVAALPISREMVEAIVREALTQVEETSDCTILLHPEDFELLQRANSPVLLSDAGGEKIRFEQAQQLSRGSCLVQTRFGIVDARRETKLSLLKQSLELS
jgi:flagellar assembly protein FliH